MSEPFIAEIRIFAGNFAPRNWAVCNGQLLPISQNTALFSLIGTVYGGDGRTTMGLPDMQGRAPMHPGRGPGLTTRQLGERTGTETVSLVEEEMPIHSHAVFATSSRGGNVPPGPTAAFNTSSPDFYQSNPVSGQVQMSGLTLGQKGGDQAHNNMQPYLAITYIIALQGLYPSRG
ncbi:phage tail protein [Hoeflea olei]|uniref:Phage tail protein n=1 Tax=Hoeflea olei TaxID=1480615 RepID=A0A1C1YTU4_9HYPH|nr:tail fiber protein [Hoeflea olei]OCW56915.1 phage tail protein [Hoeflea olei]